MKYASVCSGIEAPTVAWHSMGWRPVWFCENAPFPSAVLKYHYPTVPNLGDLNQLHEQKEIHRPIDLIFGGTPCPSFSSAGSRSGLSDSRGQLAIKFFRLAKQLRPRWLVWENVTGAFSSNERKDFGFLLRLLEECGYSCAWRTLDAQFFGVPQRRRRIFIVGYLGTNWRYPTAVLFDAHGLRWNPKKGRKTGEEIAGPLSSRVKSGGFPGTDGALSGLIQPITGPLMSGGKTAGSATLQDAESGQLIVSSKVDAFKPSVVRNGRGMPAPIHPALCAEISATTDTRPVIFDSQQITSLTNRSNPKPGDPAPTLTAKYQGDFLINFNADQITNPNDRTNIIDGAPASPLLAKAKNNCVIGQKAGGVRRLTPLECERLMGLPDNYTKIPWRGKPRERCPDGHRYRACGNSIVVPVLKWLGDRIQAVEAIIKNQDQ